MRVLPLLLLILLTTLAHAAERGFVPVRRAAGDHIALVIGNGGYPDAPLANPVNDAGDVARAFTAIGFQVEVVTDADKAQMLVAIARFRDRMAKAKAAVFYYAGHGVQVDGANWLLPVARLPGETIEREDEVRLRAVDAGEVLLGMERAKVPVAMVVLDACRNNPFSGSGRSLVKGLAQLNAPPGSIVVYATAPGHVAADGQGRNSPFTQAFLAQLGVPGQSVDTMLMQVRRGVRESTQGVQVPWSMTSMTDTFAFVPAITPDEEKAMKEAMLKDLHGQAAAIASAEAAAAEQKRIEESALAAKQAEVERLDAQIAEMKRKLGAGDGAAQPGDGGGLQAMLEVVRKKQAQQEELVEMQRKADAARQAREVEIALMKSADAQASRVRDQQRLDRLAADLQDYREIARSEFGKDMAQQAWDEVLKKWGQAPGSIRRDDVATLESVVAPVIGAEHAAAAAADRAAVQAFADGGRAALEGFAASYPQHIRAAEARRQAALIPAWASGLGTDAGGLWARLEVGGRKQVMRLIPAGRLQMGSADGDADERPLHAVELGRPFWLADSEVTQGLWQAVMGANPSTFAGDDERPVEQVTWQDCQDFIARLNAQVPGLAAALPSEAQWEYACRAGTTGDHAGDLDAMAWFAGNAGDRTHPVRTRAANAWGLYDMHGNVAEWCQDWYGGNAYAAGPARDPAGPRTGVQRVVRGGSWGSLREFARSAIRGRYAPDYRFNYLGLRIAAQAAP